MDFIHVKTCTFYLRDPKRTEAALVNLPAYVPQSTKENIKEHIFPYVLSSSTIILIIEEPLYSIAGPKF